MMGVREQLQIIGSPLWAAPGVGALPDVVGQSGPAVVYLEAGIPATVLSSKVPSAKEAVGERTIAMSGCDFLQKNSWKTCKKLLQDLQKTLANKTCCKRRRHLCTRS